MEITEILSKIQSELSIPKNQFNKFGKYYYRNCDDILEALKPVLVKYQACVTATDDLMLIGDRYYVVATATLHVNSAAIKVHAYAREPLSQKGMSEAQLTGSTSSYARKYALNGLFALDDNKDADHDFQNVKAGAPDDSKPKTYKNFKFLDIMKGYKADFGEDEYKNILASHGYEKSNQIPPDKMKEVWADFKAKHEILKTEGGK